MIFLSESEGDTRRLGRMLAERLPPGTVVGLIGDLGAGKTRLVQAVAQSLGVPEGDVVSPTFVLIGEYAGRIPIYHFDAYRLVSPSEWSELGADEYFAGDGITFVEWADRVEALLPGDRLEILLEVASPTSRRIVLTSRGPKSDAILAGLDTPNGLPSFKE
jgi:tRNA threonylcarbamoyladenosine biosynthesis protein TsaE